ncbi:MAG: tetratricopeptide repeat protein [Candidatus Adiutrix sp.]|jgi:Flp pilus assembly protein TadD|nr:tetratricopeptide repeat protein [Candidatus Adiutrix sp.]
MDTDLMDAQFKEAERLFGQGKIEEAEAILAPLLDSEEAQAKAANYLGIIRQSQGRADEAGALFERALEAAPDDREIRGNLAFNLIGRGQWAEAKEQLQKLLAANQNDAKLWTLLAKAEQGLGNLAAAIEFLDKTLLINPDQPELREARDKLAGSAGSPARSGNGAKPSVLMCCQKSLETFALGLCDALEKQAFVKRVVADNLGAFQWPIQSAENVWLEWGSELAIAATKEPGLLADKKKVILRLHSFEILGPQAGDVNYEFVTDVVFVSHYMRQLFNRRFPGRLRGQRVHVIHNGIDLARFPFIPNKGRQKIAFVGKMDAKKDPMLMLHAFTFLKHRHPELELHAAGAPDNNRYYMAMPDFLAKNGLEQETAHFYGHVKDIPGWLADKDFILCTSPFEAQGVGLLEAMHRGLRPLIYSFPGAEELYPASFLWRNFDELEALVTGGPEPEEARRFVAEKYSMTRQADSFLKLLTTDEEVVEERPALPEAGHAD